MTTRRVWTPEEVRRHYKRLGRPVPERVERALAAAKKPRRGAVQVGHTIRYYDIEPEELIIELPFVPASRNVTEAMNHFARAKSKKMFVAMVRRYLDAQGVRAFRSKVEVELEIHFRTDRARDEDNYAPKCLGDALKGWVFTDDSARYVTWRAPKFVVNGEERTVIRIRPIGRGEVKAG